MLNRINLKSVFPTVHLDYAAKGLRCNIEIPLARTVAETAAVDALLFGSSSLGGRALARNAIFSRAFINHSVEKCPLLLAG
jgi:hypothetical protein